jgi:hypothetical protein
MENHIASQNGHAQHRVMASRTARPVDLSSPRNARAASYAVSISGPVCLKSGGETCSGSGPCR